LERIPDGVVGATQLSLVRALEDAGFSRVHERYDASAFGNCLLEFSTERFSVRVVRERGSWGIEASVPGWKEWIPVSMWRWIYEGGPLPGGSSNFEEEQDWLVRSLAGSSRTCEQTRPTFTSGSGHVGEHVWPR
jgi:hypothetical protein